MKIPCPEHGAHFGDEIEDIVRCQIVWKRWKLEQLPLASRRELAEWYCSIPADKIFIETGWGVGVGLFGEYIGYDKALASNKEYEDMSDDERREWQRESIRKRYAEKRKGFRLWPIKRK